MYEPIALFNYEDKKYGILSVNETIMFFKYEDGKISLDLSDEELNLVYSAFNSLKVDESRSINLGIKKISNKDFELLYDPITKLYSWYQIINGERYYAVDENNIKLNLMYNNMNFVVYEGEIYDWKEEELKQEAQKKEQTKKTIKRTFKNAGKTLIVTIFAGSLFLNFSDSSLANMIREKIMPAPEVVNYYEEQEEERNRLFEEYESRPYSYEEIKQAIGSNQNLSDEEKEFINKLQFYFDDNYKYMDLNEVINRLKTLKIEYNEGECIKPSVTGEYAHLDNKITVYKANNFDECDKMTFMHELLHVTQLHNTNKLTLELSNELATREVLRKLNEAGLIDDASCFKNSLGKDSIYGTGYNPCMNAEYLLANIISKEDLKKFQCMTDDDILIDALVDVEFDGENPEYMSAEEQSARYRAINLIESINDLAKRDESGFLNIEFTKNKFDNIYNQIDFYYEKIYGVSMKECLEPNIINYDVAFNNIDYSTPEYMATMLTMKDEAEIQTRNVYAGFAGDKYVLPKTYFSDDHQNPIIMYSDEDAIVEVEITPELEENYKEYYEQQLGINEGKEHDEFDR